MKGRACIALAGLALVLARTASADDTQSADALFNEARKLMQNEDYARACPMLAQSQRLDPGIGTQFNLADCYEHVGKTASAWALFLEVESETKANGETARASAAHSRAEALAPKLSHVVIAVPTTHARGLVVKKDGAVVGAMQWGIALPIDPGPHTIRVSAPGRKPWESTLVVLPDGLTVALPIPDLPSNDGSAVEEPAPSDAAGDGEPSDVEPRPASAKHEGGLGGQALAGIALGGVGALGIVVGTIAGAVSLAKHNASENGCQNNVCSAPAGAERTGAIHAGNWSTAAFSVGLVAGAAGVVLWVTKPSDTPAKAGHEKSVGLVPLVGGGTVGGGIVARF